MADKDTRQFLGLLGLARGCRYGFSHIASNPVGIELVSIHPPKGKWRRA
jgi:hypothetical protein